MSDAEITFILIASIFGVIAFVAQCQLFSIKGSLKDLVRLQQQAMQPPAAPPVPFDGQHCPKCGRGDAELVEQAGKIYCKTCGWVDAPKGSVI